MKRNARMERERTDKPLPSADQALIAELDTSVSEFVRFVQRLPDEALAPSCGPGWGAREVLAHLVFWHEDYAAILAALLAGRQPEAPSGSFKELNTRAVRQLEHATIAELLKRFKDAQARLQTLYGPASAGNVAFAFKIGGKVWPVQEAILRIAGHVHNHRLQLERNQRLGRVKS